MKHVLIYFCIPVMVLFTGIDANAGTWYFGDHSNPDFNGTKQVLATDGQILLHECPASLSDKPGNSLLNREVIPVFMTNSIHSLGMASLQPGVDGNIPETNGNETVAGYFRGGIMNTWSDKVTGLQYMPDLPAMVRYADINENCGVRALFQMIYHPEECSYEFIDMSMTNSSTTIVAWQWTFGDGTSSNVQNPVHHYVQPGVYDVCLKVTAYNGSECCVASICMRIEVGECGKCRVEPQMNIYAERDECTGECWYVFEGSTTFANREVAAWLWDFGDGNTASGQNVTHQYTASGGYMVCLTIITVEPHLDGGCCVFTICRDIDVEDCIGSEDIQGRMESPVKTETPDLLQNERSIVAYPNPTENILYVEVNVPEERELNFRLVDMTGKVYSLGQVQNSGQFMVKEFHLEHLAPGIYMLWVEGGNYSESHKIQILK